MTSTGKPKKDLSASDICRIIKQCQGTGVSKITIGDLSIEFESHRNEAAVSGQITDHNPEISPEQTIEAEFLSKELAEAAYIAQLQIDDPLAYEKLIFSKDLERNRLLHEA